MKTRRAFFFSLIGGVAAASVAQASTYGRVLKAGKPKLIKGNPDKVDFGHGLVVPMSRDAFDTLWEGDDRWMSYGHGFGENDAAAMGQAEKAAIGTMKLFLLTLAFEPEKLERVEGGGWRLKSRNIADLVRGDIDLPGRPIMPTTDEMYNYTGGEASAQSTAEETIHATTGWVIWKSDVQLDYVRQNAILVPAGP